MRLKKLLGIITIVIVVVFSMMLTTSYAWYAFDNSSTTFEGMTNNDDIIVSYQKGEYINATSAIPITKDQVDKYSEKNNFNIKVKNNVKDTEMLVSISLVDIVIDGSLQNSNFKVELYHQSTSVANLGGNVIGISGATTRKLADVILDNEVLNNFELRLYILDNNSDQSSLQNKNFQAKIKVDVISRLKSSFNDYNESDIYISSVTIDGEASDYIPTEGFYKMSAICNKGSNLTWNPLNKTIGYSKGSYINDSCSLNFTSSTDYPLLSEMPVGSYVKYTGTNGCDGIHCEGYNANYVNDTNMGYCDSSNYKFHTNGWRIGYVEDGSVHLISAGSLECTNTYVDDRSSNTSAQTLSTAYYYGSGYVFDNSSGTYTLTGVTNSVVNWANNYNSIIEQTPYTCKKTSSTATCTILYEVISHENSTTGKAYIYNNYEQTSGIPVHSKKINNIALKYCNKNYSKSGICDNTTAHGLNVTDFKKITGKTLSSSSCFNSYSNKLCGYSDDLIDNGGYYWFDTTFNSSSSSIFTWSPSNRYVSNRYSDALYGVRPVLILDSSVAVIDGDGTYKRPYVIVNV